MAQNNSTSSNNVRRFDKELSEDVNDSHLPENVWTQARNAINNSKTGDLGKLGNEPANQYCVEAPYIIIGVVHIDADIWAIFSTDDTNSEIGLFKETGCIYTSIVNDVCLSFSSYHLVRGVSKSTSDCNYKVYWDDGLNPSRVITVVINNFIDNHYTNPNSTLPWIQNCVNVNGCFTCTNTAVLDCELIRLARHIQTPCVSIQKGVSGGTLANGSYIAVIAYCIYGEKVTDYFTPSNVQPLFEHDNVAGSIDITIDNADTSFTEFELVVISIVNSQTIAKRLGLYNITQQKITLDTIDPTLTTIPVELLPIQTTVYEKTDAMYNVGSYLIRVAPTTKFDFNYQPLANQIVAKWQAVEYSANYYKNGGSNTGYMRDELYSFFIRWIYNTGDKSSSYHIPGRPEKIYAPLGLIDTAPYGGTDALVGDTMLFETYNTGILTGSPLTILPDGGIVTGEGEMGYWQSTEFYPNDKPDIWNAGIAYTPYSGTTPTDYDLCGKHIRHHKFPDNAVHPNAYHYANAGTSIRIMGVKFENVLPPVDNNGNLIPNIIGYEILRGTRGANKTIIAKGIINNMGQYDLHLEIDGIPAQPNAGSKWGAYQNYPYNDVTPDQFLSTTQTSCTAAGTEHGNNPQSSFASKLFTFHSPDTTFARPFLSSRELKLYGEYFGQVQGKFEWSENHPKSKVVTDLAFLVSTIAGIGIAYIASNGKKTIRRQKPNVLGTIMAAGSTEPIQLAAALIAVNSANSLANTAQTADNLTGTALLASIIGGNGGNAVYGAYDLAAITAAALTDVYGGTKQIDYEEAGFLALPFPLRAANGVFNFFNYLTTGTDDTLRLIRAMLKYQHFAAKYNSHAFYNGFNIPPVAGNRRKEIETQSYIGPEIVDLTSDIRINNLYRNRTVALNLQTAMTAHGFDNSRQTATQYGASNPSFYLKDPTKDNLLTNTSAYYSALKQRIRNAYGQINSISQLPINNCYTSYSSIVSNTTTLFGGDIYLGRYAEKTTFFYFYDWLYNQPDGYGYNYDLHKNILYPRYWLNMNEFDTNDFTSSFATNILNPALWITPNDLYNLDNYAQLSFRFGVKHSYFYLFNSGIRDFFVESEINIDFRDYGELDSQKHYPIISDTKTIFDTSIIKAGNYYKYDWSLSTSKTFMNFVSWANTQTVYYDPYLAETCYTYTPKRVIYSLPSQFESVKDNWLIFLANNYHDFQSYVTCIKPINKSGAIIFFESASPVQFQGTDQLQTGLGTKLTIGDGGLFSQPMQSIMNADLSYEYGSCQDSFSVINTPMGIYWISENQGKVFHYGGGLEEVSLDNMKWWFAQYLPYQLLNYFPDFQLTNNPVTGIGCQSIFDNQNQLVYFCKRDYVLRDDIPTNIKLTYIQNDQFAVNVVVEDEYHRINTISLGDELYFKDASWTISYDPKTKGFISYHDWHPTLSLPGKNTFMTVNPADKRSIWIHNERCDLYCNYYDKPYPWEIEWMVNTVNQVNTVRSIEYQLEVYKYADNCYDRFHQLDFNFDEAVVYNTEQCSGLLKLNLSPRNNAPLILNYPIINPTSIDILYSKVEQKYRFNQFWDITRDRGEFPIGSNYPPPTPNPGSYATQTIWNTEPNGYIRILNNNNMDYNKFALQRKKFRHYTTSVLLRRLESMDKKFLVMLSTNKNLYSPR